MGGTSDDRINFGMSNLISLCRECHSYIHANPAESYKYGWLLKTWQDPETTGINLKFAVLMLKMDGNIELIGECDSFLPSRVACWHAFAEC